MENNRAVGKAIRSLSNRIMRRFDADRPDREVLERITGINRLVIGFLAEQRQAGKEVYQRDLEEVFDVTRSTVSKVVDLMERKGLVERRAVAGDARLKKLELTPKALELSARMRAYAKGVEGEITAGFTPQEIETLLGYIDRMKKNLGEE